MRVYSPLVANQEPTRPATAGKRNESWSIVVNASEIRDIPTSRVADGSGLPWKLATWGSTLDERLLSRLERHFPCLSDLEKQGTIIVAEGPALEAELVADGENKTVKVDEVVRKPVLKTSELLGLRHVFTFPDAVLEANGKFYASVRRGSRGLAICKAPHVIVSAARNFAVYEERYLVVPPRQIGIVSPTGDRQFLKALSLYLSSDFAFYHQFLTSTELGVKRDRATLGALRNMPISIRDLSADRRKQWEDLHSRLMRTTPQSVRESQESVTGPAATHAPAGRRAE